MGDTSRTNTNSEINEKSGLILLTDYIEQNAEHSRWSTAITLLISITVASLIALLSSVISFQEGSIIHNSENSCDTLTLYTDSMYFGLIISDDCILSQDTTITSTLTQSQIRHQGGIPNDSLIKKTVENDKTVKSIKIKFQLDRGNNELPLLLILFSCTTFLGFIFTVIFYLLRKKISNEMDNTKELLENKHKLVDIEDVVTKMKKETVEIKKLLSENNSLLKVLTNNTKGDEK